MKLFSKRFGRQEQTQDSILLLPPVMPHLFLTVMLVMMSSFLSIYMYILRTYYGIQFYKKTAEHYIILTQ